MKPTPKLTIHAKAFVGTKYSVTITEADLGRYGAYYTAEIYRNDGGPVPQPLRTEISRRYFNEALHLAKSTLAIFTDEATGLN